MEVQQTLTRCDSVFSLHNPKTTIDIRVDTETVNSWLSMLTGHRLSISCMDHVRSQDTDPIADQYLPLWRPFSRELLKWN